MGWDDSDDDDDLDIDLGAVLRENEKRQRREEGLPSESEEEDEEEVVKPQHPVKKKEEIYVPLADPVAEKARQKKLQEEQEMAGFGTLVGDEFVKVDEEAERKKKEEETKEAAAKAAAKAEAKAKPKVEVYDEFIELKIETLAGFNSMAEKIVNKVKEGPLKGGAVRFINEAIKLLIDDLSIAELEKMDKRIADMLKQKKMTKTEKRTEEQKGSVAVTKNTKFNVEDELNTMYGGGEWDDGDWDDGDWDDGDWE